ncbi:hypothetical protein [Flavobacterium sp.]|uniref:hypothetical protein n=1 Tax=Flavobacterium sp. TaxID=239 RepID=UPI0039E39EDD
MDTQKPFIGKTISILWFYTAYAGVIYLSNIVAPKIAPLLILLLVPVGILYFGIHLLRLFKGNPFYLECLGVHLLCWIAMALLIKLEVLVFMIPMH